MKKEFDKEFHKKHEILTEQVYNNPDMLPSRYVFVITNLCNLRCDFCFQGKKPRKDAMSVEDWINLAKQIPEYARVTLTGGEPFIFKDFNKVFSFIAERFDCNIITNGLLLNEDKIEYILSFPKFRVLSVSIDDIGNTTRGLTKDQWDYLINILKYFVKRKKELNSECLLDIKTMILDENAENLFDIYRFFIEEIKPDTHAFQFLKGSPIQHADEMFDFEEITKESNAFVYKKFDIIKEQLEKIRKYNLENNRVSYLHPKIASLSSQEPITNIDYINNKNHVKERFLKCKFPWASVHINVDGTLFPCLAVRIGNVKEKSLREIMSSKEMNRFKELIKKEGTVEACNRCGWIRPY